MVQLDDDKKSAIVGIIAIVAAILMIVTACSMGNIQTPDSNASDIKAVEFKYKGHDMVYFVNFGDRSGTYIHSPECKKCLDRFD